MYKLLLLLALLCSAPLLWGQGLLQTHYDLNDASSGGTHNRAVASMEGGYVLLASDDATGNRAFRKVNAQGGTEWTYLLPNSSNFGSGIGLFQRPADSSYLALFAPNGAGTVLQLIRLTPQGQLISQQQTTDPLLQLPIRGGFPYRGITALLTSDEHVLIGGSNYLSNDSTNEMLLTKLTLSGRLVWERTYPNTGTDRISGITQLLEAPSGHYWLMGGDAVGDYYGTGGGTNFADVAVIEVDTAGVQQWRQRHNVYGYDELERSIATRDGGALLIGQYKSGPEQRGYVLKLSAQGTRQWAWRGALVNADFSTKFTHAVENRDGSYLITGDYNYAGGSIALIRLSASGTLIWERGHSTGYSNGLGYEVFERAPNQAMTHHLLGQDSEGLFWMGFDSTGGLYANRIEGQYRIDANANCQTEASETPIAGRIVVATQGARQFYGTVDTSGHYTIELDRGAYGVSARTISPYWQLCQPSQAVTISTSQAVDTVDFALQGIDSCTHMEVQLSAPFLRRCFTSEYIVHCTNYGTVDATNSYVDVELDPYLTYVSSTAPLLSQTNNTYRFDLATVAPLQQKQFRIVVLVDCDSTALGQVHCTYAHIYPDTVCNASLWSGAIIQANTGCVPDSVVFTLTNNGAAMVNPRQYSVVEEHVMIRQAPFQLGSGNTQTVTLPARPGAVYRLEAEQETGYPAQLGDPIAIANQVVCNGLVMLNQPDVLGQFYQGNSNSMKTVDCQPNIGAYDPNDKYAQPVGYGPQHYLNNNTPIDYRIRFQNTGTDTAFTVVIVDTLDSDLDPASLRMGPSSHPYTWSLSGGGVLKVRFDHILLPDSNVNEPLSHGFIKFRIDQDPNLADGTRLTNQAGIYFDFNPPIVTNEVFHTIGTNFVRFLGAVQPLDDQLTVRVFPNPFAEMATLEVEQGPYGHLQLHVYSVMGPRVATFEGEGQQVHLHRGALPAGMYVYRLVGDGQPLATGKFIIR